MNKKKDWSYFRETIAGAFRQEFMDEEKCRRFILELLYPNGPQCPFCGNRKIITRDKNRFWLNRRCSCAECGRRFNATSKTILNSMNFSFSELMLVIALIDIGLGNPQIARIVGRRRDAVRHWRYKFEALSKVTNGKR